MSLYTTLASLSQTAASNAADGSADAPSTIDNQLNLLASFIAQLRDGIGFTNGITNVGQCRLQKTGANLLLVPYGGNGLSINGTAYAIPSAGISLAPTALTPGTLYYIYAYMTGSVMTLEASTTTHATSTTTGVEIKSGDATRTLVGMARPIAGPAWQDTTNQRFVASWFNRVPLTTYANFSTNRTTGNTSLSEVNTEIRNEFLTWPVAVNLSIDSYCTNNTTGAISQTAIAIDGAQVTGFSAGQAYTTGALIPISCSYSSQPGEGYHYATLWSATTAGSTTLYPGAGSFNVTSLKGTVFI